MAVTYKAIHIVSKGESFWTISQLYEIEGKQLLDFNKDKGITNTLPVFSQRTPKWSLQPGDEVYIPINKEKNEKKIAGTPQNHKQFLPEPNNRKLKKNSPNIGSTSKCTQCNFYELSVQCSNKKRGYVHKVDSSMGPSQVFQVIAGGGQHDPNNNFDTITVKFDADSCKQGKPKSVCSVVKLDDGTAIPNGQSFEAHAPQSLLVNDDFTTFIKEFLIPNSHSKRYELIAESCNSNGHPRIIIDNFSPVKWDGKITLGYFHEQYKNTYKRNKVQGYWSIEGGISIENGGDKVSIGSPKGVQKASRNNDLTKKVFKNAQDFLNKTTPLLSSIKSDYAKVEINWPLLSLKGAINNTEIHNSPDVDLEGNISIGFNPLIGAKFTVDILNILIAAAAGAASAAAGGPVFAKFLIKIKKKAAEGNKYGKVGIEILFSISGNISGELNWDFKPLNNTVKGGVEGTVPIVIEGKAEIELDILWVSIAAGAKAGAKTGFGAELKPGWDSVNGAFLGGCVKFDGITLYYVFYSRVGGESMEKDDPFTPEPKNKKAKAEYENSEKFEWIKASKWPDNDSGNSIALSKGGI